MYRALAVLILLCLSICSFAYAEPQTIDLDVMTADELTALQSSVDAALRALSSDSAEVLTSASRKEPAHVGQTVQMKTENADIAFTVNVSLLGIYRGDAYVELTDGKYMFQSEPSSSDGEMMAAHISVEFVGIDKIIGDNDDPPLKVDKAMNFSLYTSDGTRIDSIKYDIQDLPSLQEIFEGATTEGYMYFEVDKNDDAPFLVYKPIMFDDPSAWFSLK